jgi:hypothetical protein
MACGGSNSNTNTATTTTETQANQQVGTSGGGIAVGAGSTTGAITIQTPDNAALAVANHALQHSTDTTAQALGAVTAVSSNALASNGQVVQSALGANAATTGAAFGFGEMALNAVQGTANTAIAAVQNTSANEQTLLASLYAQNSALAQAGLQIGANAAPQTAAAQGEIMAGTGPLGGSHLDSTTIIVLGLAGAVVLYLMIRA